MKLIRFLQRYFLDEIPFEISTFAATCGNVLVKSFLTNRISLSLGCPTSRELGFISDDELVVGIPGRLLGTIFLEK